MDDMDDMDLSSIDDNDDRKASAPIPSNCCIYFLIDASKTMFEKNPSTGVSYFEEGLKAYLDVIVDKCTWNKDDFIGLLVFGVKESNKDPYIEHVLVLSKLQIVNHNMVKNVIDILNNKVSYYENISSDNYYSLLDAMRQAETSYCELKKKFLYNKIILLTSNDDPLAQDESKRHEIRLKAKAVKNVGLEFDVLELKSDWKDDIFWKDVKMIFNANENEYKKISMRDMILELKKPTRILRQTILNVFEGLTVPIAIHNISNKVKDIQYVKVDAATNVPVHRSTVSSSYETNDYDVAENDEEEDVPVWESTMYTTCRNNTYEAKYGNKIAVFSEKEKKGILTFEDHNINVIGFKPININPMLHVSAPYFITWNIHATYENKIHFTAFLNRCAAKNVMAICSACIHVVKLFFLIPCLEKGGFYLYPRPFKDQIRSMECICDKNCVKPLLDEKCENLWREIIHKRHTESFNYTFKFPKLAFQLAHVQALALDQENPVLEGDSTEFPPEKIRDELGDLLNAYLKMYPQEHMNRGKKRSYLALTESIKSDSLNRLDIIIEENKINSCTVEDLKNFAKLLHLPSSGRKADLINRILENYDNNM